MKSIINYKESGSRFIKEIIHDELSKGDRFPISDITKKYGIETLNGYSATTTKIFRTGMSLTTLAIVVIVVVIIVEKCESSRTGILRMVNYAAGISPISAPSFVPANSDWEDNAGINDPSINILKLNQVKARRKTQQRDHVKNSSIVGSISREKQQILFFNNDL